MAEATVTIKLNPAEFDFVREAVTLAHDAAREAGADLSATANERAKARSKQLQLKELGAKLGV